MSGVILATALGAFGTTAAATVGTGAIVAAGIGAGTTLYGGAKSFSDAGKARKRGDAAQRAADKAIEEAKKRVDVNVYEQLSIAKEPYELMREAQLVQGAMGLQTAVEGSSRGAAATAGRVQMAQGQQQAAIRAEQAQQMDELNKLVAKEDARRQQQLAGIAMDEAAGAQLAVRDAEEDRAKYITQGVGTLGSIAQGLSTSYAEGNFGKFGQPNSKKMLNRRERAPFLAAEEEYDRMMAQQRLVDSAVPGTTTSAPASGIGQVPPRQYTAFEIPGTTQAQPMITGPGGYDMSAFGMGPSQQATSGPLSVPQFQIPEGFGNYIGPDMRPTEYVRNFRNRQLGI